MITVFYLLGYLGIVGFIVMACLKMSAYMKASPLHVRWEIYPVPHEGAAKSAYGGSFMEEKEWWNKPRHADHCYEALMMLKEILLLHATFEHNRPLWYRTYPFHFGMYMLMGGTIVVVLSVLLQMLGVSADGGFMLFVGNVVNAMVLIGALGIVGGGVALILRRMNDAGLKAYTTNEHFLNLGSFVVFGIFTLLAWVFNPGGPSYFEQSCTFIRNLLTFNFVALGSTWFTLNMLVGFLVLILIPTTNMKHLILKYFMYHDIRWGDTPTVYSEKNQRTINEMLQYNVTWSAEHINPNGQSKTWVDVATTNPAAPKNND